MERELLIERGECLAVCERLINQASAENRDLNNEEQQQYDTAWARVGDIETQVERHRNLQVRQASLAQARDRRFTTGLPASVGTQGGAHAGVIEINYRGKTVKCKPGTRAHQLATPEYNQHFMSWMGEGPLSPSAGYLLTEGSKGGYMAMPEQMNYELLSLVDEACVMRQIIRNFTTRAETLGNPYRKTKASGMVRGTEITPSTELTDAEYGKKELKPTHATGYVAPTIDFLEGLEMQGENVVLTEMGIVIREFDETDFLLGDGNGKPLGVYVASANGINTDRDVASGSATGITYDGLCDAVGKISDNYLINGQCYWVCHRDFLTRCWKIKDSTGQPILKTIPNGRFFYDLMGFPVLRSDFAPKTFTNGLYVAVFGNFQYYWNAESPETGIRKLDQIQFLNNKIVYAFRRKNDALPVRPSAFARVKCST